MPTPRGLDQASLPRRLSRPSWAASQICEVNGAISVLLKKERAREGRKGNCSRDKVQRSQSCMQLDKRRRITTRDPSNILLYYIERDDFRRREERSATPCGPSIGAKNKIKP